MVDGFSGGLGCVKPRLPHSSGTAGSALKILCTEIRRKPEEHILSEYGVYYLEVEKASLSGNAEQFVLVDFLPSSFSCSVTDGTLHRSRAESCRFSALLSHFSIGTTLN